MKTLIFDIETKPPLLYAWPPLYDLSAGVGQVQQRGAMICFAAKWWDQKKVMFFSEYKDGQEGMARAAFDLLDRADVVVHFNGASFDEKHINTELKALKLDHELGAYSPFQRLDLKKISSKHFRFDSHKLQYLSQQLDIGEKLKHEGWDMWQGWIDGDEAMIRKMERYNRKDVLLTQELLEELRVWLPVRISPVLEQLDAGGTAGVVCPECGSDHKEKRGFHYTKVSKYQRFRCLDCGRYYRDNKRLAGAQSQAL